MGGLGFKRKKAAAFGAYGWSGKSVKLLTAQLKECGFEVVADGSRALWNSDVVPGRRPGHPLEMRGTPPSWAVSLGLEPIAPGFFPFQGGPHRA